VAGIVVFSPKMKRPSPFFGMMALKNCLVLDSYAGYITPCASAD